ncbi:MAG: helix-turn-helix domain-containing protein [Litorimonas sp.]
MGTSLHTGLQASEIRSHSFPSPFGDWSVSESDAPPDLVGDVVQVWESSGFVGNGHERMVPRGTLDLIFNLAGPQALYPDGRLDRPAIFRRVWLSGLFDRPLHVGPAYAAAVHGTHLVGASLSPVAARRLFGLDPRELRNVVIDGEDLFGMSALSAWHRIGEAKDVTARFACVLSFLRTQRARHQRDMPFSALWAVGATVASGGRIRIGTLCDDLSVSRKHLSTLVGDATGMTPKGFSRLQRFRRAMAALERAERTGFAELALDLGFSDQSHFINDFGAFAGESPQRFLSVRSSDGESVLFE